MYKQITISTFLILASFLMPSAFAEEKFDIDIDAPFAKYYLESESKYFQQEGLDISLIEQRLEVFDDLKKETDTSGVAKSCEPEYEFNSYLDRIAVAPDHKSFKSELNMLQVVANTGSTCNNMYFNQLIKIFKSEIKSK